MYNKQKYILLKTIKDNSLIARFKKHHVIIAGGAIRSVFAGEHIGDYDLYFKTKQDYDGLLAKFKKDEKYSLIFSTDNAETFVNDDIKIQLIKIPELICKNPVEIVNQFDYTVCMGAYDFDSAEFILHEKFLEHLSLRELYYNIDAKYPLASLFRVRKYLSKGYKISGVEIIKLGLSINNLQMNNYQDLKIQLQGIDTAFLSELTDKLMSEEYIEKKYDFNEFLDMINQYFIDILDTLVFD